MRPQKSPAKRLEKARARRRDFSARGSTCPLCRQEFRTCEHTIQQAMDRLDEDVTLAEVEAAKDRSQ